MNTTTHLRHAGRVADVALERRSFLGLVAAGAAVVGVPTLLTGCGSPSDPQGGAAAALPIEDAIPTYIPTDYVDPDFPSVNGSTPGFSRLPDTLVTSVPTPPGSGAVFTAMTPLWGTIPQAKGNQYYAAVNEMLGSTIEFQIADGNTYGDKLATVLASSKDVPDWVCVPNWNLPPRFATEIVGNVFQDLTPYLAGDKVKAYPNLANIPSDVWKFCVFNGRLYGLPMPGEILTDATFYRQDVLDQLGITPDVRNGDDLLALALELTDAGSGRWGAEDLWTTAAIIHGVPPKWRLDDDGSLVHRIETDEYRAALAWNAKLFASGAVHPDAVAAQDGDAKQRFQSGRSLIMADGLGSWNEALRDNLGANPAFWQQPFAPFAADGGTPVLYKGNPANISSFLKKTDDEDKVKELLALANALAGPFGTAEFDLVNYGVEGVHYTKDADGLPVPTELAASEVQPTYLFLLSGPVVNAKVQYPGYVEASSAWQADAAQYLTDPLFFGQQISEPQQYASIGQPFQDLEKDISRGRKSLDDLDEAVQTWKSAGGDELRAFYQDILDNA
ncbi:extracellular solute-binding protein [Cellulomonas chengniuliangii]|uniref:extracellular solute-binding protein n=1 Tax=Cellulomonas chengniuliangii TaxID=2968084 RepID=UPI001D0EDC37|nr:extracellular solute-binding protein [Cellulomonas chengniuliangii]MCC2316334.1 extracellular solute-binding protein [Cellulomonas chengniuliangii]